MDATETKTAAELVELDRQALSHYTQQAQGFGAQLAASTVWRFVVQLTHRHQRTLEALIEEVDELRGAVEGDDPWIDRAQAEAVMALVAAADLVVCAVAAEPPTKLADLREYVGMLHQHIDTLGRVAGASVAELGTLIEAHADDIAGEAAAAGAEPRPTNGAAAS